MFCFILDTTGKITKMCFSWIIIVSSEDYLVPSPLPTFLLLFFFLASFWFILLYAELYPVSISALPSSCGTSGLCTWSFFCMEEAGKFSPSQIQDGGIWEVGKDFREEMSLSTVSVLSLFVLLEKVWDNVLCTVNVFSF